MTRLQKIAILLKNSTGFFSSLKLLTKFAQIRGFQVVPVPGRSTLHQREVSNLKWVVKCYWLNQMSWNWIGFNLIRGHKWHSPSPIWMTIIIWVTYKYLLFLWNRDKALCPLREIPTTNSNRKETPTLLSPNYSRGLCHFFYKWWDKWSRCYIF